MQYPYTDELRAAYDAARAKDTTIPPLDHFMNSCEFAALIKAHPALADAFDWKELDRNDQIDLLCLMPQYIHKCDTINFSGAHWSKLIVAQPQLADKCDWGKLHEDDWSKVIQANPLFISKRKFTIESLKRSAGNLGLTSSDKIINASDLFGDSDEGEKGNEYDAFFESDEDEDEEGDNGSTWGGETIINLNFDDSEK